MLKDLVAIEIELVDKEQREYMLQKALADVAKEYDYVLIDCAPSLGLITLNSLVAADSVIIPIQCEYFALEGLGKLLNTVKSIQNIHNPNLDIEGLLLTMFDSRLRLSNQVVEEVRKHFSTMVFDTIIRRNTRLGEAPSYGEQALGRGLSALLKETSADINSASDKNADKLVGSIVEIELNSIDVNPFQPRTYFDEEAISELANSIKELGVIQPITVRKLEGNKFQLVSGERRFRASKLIGNTSIPAYIRIANDQEMLEMALVENIQRKNLDPIEVALSYQRLIEDIQLTQEQLSVRVGKKRSTVTNYLRLLKLDPIIQTGMRDGFISMGHGRALINVDSSENQLNIYTKIVKDKLSVRQTEELVKNLKEGNTTTSKKSQVPSFAKNSLHDLTSFFGNKVTISVNSKGKGKLTIPFTSEEDFNRIKNLLK